jgi:hypothetical protein
VSRTHKQTQTPVDSSNTSFPSKKSDGGDEAEHEAQKLRRRWTAERERKRGEHFHEMEKVRVEEIWEIDKSVVVQIDFRNCEMVIVRIVLEFGRHGPNEIQEDYGTMSKSGS